MWKGTAGVVLGGVAAAHGNTRGENYVEIIAFALCSYTLGLRGGREEGKGAVTLGARGSGSALVALLEAWGRNCRGDDW